MHKTIITVVGKDTVGIIANVCTFLADHNINVLDISQTIIDGFFNMMMIVDIKNSTVSFTAMQDSLSEIGNKMGLKIQAQKEEIFDMMHRV